MTELCQDRKDGLYEGSTGRAAFRDTILKYQQHEKRCMERIDELKAAATVASKLPSDEWSTDSENGDPLAPGGLWERRDVPDKRGTAFDRAVVWARPAEPARRRCALPPSGGHPVRCRGACRGGQWRA
ncbi:hypothetical protein GCM10010339_21690 [Streptomyces alanosinicus]|uniref:Uncharacterized protein n=1 Tax=Streptomyces alanosinicus TaxID=68171 RepID=A0A918YG09_9ACTN|nr:hypothetical protein GCM10010339_21690 [Streptomyces alanosinicus]